jgi:hypothetical protein
LPTARRERGAEADQCRRHHRAAEDTPEDCHGEARANPIPLPNKPPFAFSFAASSRSPAAVAG